jgi:hypothetical protein
MTNHSIPEDVFNSDLLYCIREFVRSDEQQEILKDWWFRDYTIECLAEKYHKSTTAIKSILYGIGDRILLKADKLSNIRGKF